MDNLPHFDSIETLVRETAPAEPVYCVRPEVIRAQVHRFQRLFAGRVLFAVKSNPHPAVLDVLQDAGIRDFDTASLGEMQLVRERFPNAGCYYMHAVKSRDAIARAYELFGARHFVIDHVDELEKLRQVLGNSDAVVLVRLATRGDGVLFNLSSKFGASVSETAALLDRVKSYGFDAGLCFHVGSQCVSTAAFDLAFDDVARVLALSATKISCLDVGGGFPAPYQDVAAPTLESFMDVIRSRADALHLSRCELMCEPGRVLVAEGMSVLTRVELRKDHRLYLNDGIYGSLFGMTIGVRFPMRLVRPGVDVAARHGEFLAYGPTCDGLDELPQRFLLPEDVAEGDWIEIGCVGAYTTSLRTTFNGFYPNTFVTVAQPFRKVEASLDNNEAEAAGGIRR